MNKTLIRQLDNIRNRFSPAIETAVKNTSKEILRESVENMRRFPQLIRISKLTGKPYYTQLNTTNTLRVLSGDLKRSILSAARGHNTSGGIFKARYVGDNYLVTFGSRVRDDSNRSYPREHDRGRFSFLGHKVTSGRYMKAVIKEVNKAWR